MTQTAKATQSKGRACQGKRRHPDRAAAEQHLQRLIRNRAAKGGLMAYECRHCNNYATGRNGWHVGHRPGITRSR